MPRLKRLKAREVVRILRRCGFEVASTRGSHSKLVRVAATGRREILVVPMHRDLTVGTLSAIYRQASRFIPAEELRPEFVAD